MNKALIFIIVGILAFGNAFASGDNHSGHEHGKEEEHSGHKDKGQHDSLDEEHGDHEDHGKGEEHGDHKDHEKSGEHKGHDEHEGHGGGKAIGAGKAIEAVDEVKGFKLSKEAIKRLKLKLLTVDGDEFTIKKSTLVASKNLKGIYRFRGGYFKFLPIVLIKEINKKYLVKVKGVEFGDQIVIDGVGLLRVADVYSTDKSEYGHGH